MSTGKNNLSTVILYLRDDRQICFGPVKGKESTSSREWEDKAKNVTQNEKQGDMYKIESKTYEEQDKNG